MSIQWFDDFSWCRGGIDNNPATPYLDPWPNQNLWGGNTGPEGSNKDWACRGSANDTRVVKTVAANVEYWVGGDFLASYQAVGAGTLVDLMDSAGVSIAKLRVYTDHSIALVSAHDTNTKLVECADAFPPMNNWATYALRIKANDGAGEAELWVNGFPIGNVNAKTIKGTGGETSIARVAWVGAAGDNVVFTHIWAVAMDGVGRCSRLQRPRCFFLTPTGDTAVADFAKSTGTTGYTLVDEAPASLTDYLYGTTGQKSKFTVTPIVSLTGRTVLAVKAGVISAIGGAGGVSQKASLTSNGAEITSATRQLEGSLRQSWVMSETNPDGGVAWTPTTAAAVQVGVEAV